MSKKELQELLDYYQELKEISLKNFIWGRKDSEELKSALSDCYRILIKSGVRL